MIRRIVAAKATKRPGDISTPTVSLIVSSSVCASSKTTTVMLGKDRTVGGDVEAVEVGVHHDHVGGLSPTFWLSRRSMGRPAGTGQLPDTRRCPTLTALQAASTGVQSSSARSPVELDADQLSELLDLGPGDCCHVVEFELALNQDFDISPRRWRHT